MATQDVTVSVTMKWDQAAVVLAGIAPQKDGSIMLEVHGTTKDQNGANVNLSPVQISVQPGQVAVIDNLLARALTELRKKNGLES